MHVLDHLDLLLAGAREHDVERRLLLGRRPSAVGGRRTRGGDGNRCGRGDAPLLLDLVLELDQLEHRHAPELLEHRVNCSHPQASSSSESVFFAGASASASGSAVSSSASATCSASAAADASASAAGCSVAASASGAAVPSAASATGSGAASAGASASAA